jgi:hypothetical protein
VREKPKNILGFPNVSTFGEAKARLSERKTKKYFGFSEREYLRQSQSAIK